MSSCPYAYDSPPVPGNRVGSTQCRILLALLLFALLVTRALWCFGSIPLSSLSFAHEHGEIASALVRHGAFANPFGLERPSQIDLYYYQYFLPWLGPRTPLREPSSEQSQRPLELRSTGWMPPLYALLEASVFSLSGVQSSLSATLIFFLELSLISLAVLLFLTLLAEYGYSMRIQLAYFLLALAYLLLQTQPDFDDDFAFQLFFVSLGFCAPLLYVRQPTTARRSFLFISALLLPLAHVISTFAFLLHSAGLVWRLPQVSIKRTLCAAIGTSILVGTLWSLSVYRRTGVLGLIKTNAWHEFYEANVVDADGVYEYSTFFRNLAYFNIAQFTRYHRVGEHDYLAPYRQESLRWLRENPGTFARKVAQRASNIFFYMQSPFDLSWIDTRKYWAEDLTKLLKAEIVIFKAQGMNLGENNYYWSDVQESPSEFRRRIAPLNLYAKEWIVSEWLRARAEVEERRHAPRALLRGIAYGLLPSLCILFAYFSGRLRRSPLCSLAVMYYFSYALPFVLVAHYERYQLPLMGLLALFPLALLGLPLGDPEAAEGKLLAPPAPIPSTLQHGAASP